MFSKFKYHLYIILASIALMLLQHCHYGANIRNQQSEHDAIMSFEENEKNALIKDNNLKAQEIVKMEQNIVSERVAKEYVEKQFDGFRKIQSYMRVELLKSIKGIAIPFNEDPANEFNGIDLVDSSFVRIEDVEKNFMRVPKTISFYDEPWIQFDGKIVSAWGGFEIDSLNVIDKLDAVFGYKKPDKKFKFFRRAKPVLELKSYSPYSSVPYVNNLTVKDNRSGLEKLLTSRAACFAYGFGVNTLIQKTTPGWDL